MWKIKEKLSELIVLLRNFIDQSFLTTFTLWANLADDNFYFFS